MLPVGRLSPAVDKIHPPRQDAGGEFMGGLIIETDVAARHPDCLRDESRRTGCADAVVFPQSEAEIVEALALARTRGWKVTTQGSRTGITGGAVPDGGLILNLSRMNRLLGLRYDSAANLYFLRVQPGTPLADINQAVATRQFDTTDWSPESLQALESFRQNAPFFFPPDPTEWTASIGGMASCNASGARTFEYGPTRRHIAALRAVLADGGVLALRRGQCQAQGRKFKLTTDKGRELRGALPAYVAPPIKSAAGYHVVDDMDLMDLLIGSEGTLGVFSELEIRLLPAPAVIWGVLAFLPDELSAARFVRGVRGDPVEPAVPADTLHPAALEFFDARALDLLRREKARGSPVAAELPDLPPAFHTGVYVEYHAGTEEEALSVLQAMSAVLDACGGNEAGTWLADNAEARERFRKFRHAVPESVNLIIDERRRAAPELTKLGTDMAVPDARLTDVLALYHAALDPSGLDYVIFGHIGNNHLHVNILPRDANDYERGKQMYLDWAREIVKWGGTVAAEHGIGKLKAPMLRLMYGDEAVGQMRALKRIFDPTGMLNPGNLFPP